MKKKIYFYMALALVCVSMSNLQAQISSFPYYMDFGKLPVIEGYDPVLGEYRYIDYQGWNVKGWALEIDGSSVTSEDEGILGVGGLLYDITEGTSNYAISPQLDLSKMKDPYMTFAININNNDSISRIEIQTSKNTADDADFQFAGIATSRWINSLRLNKDVKYIRFVAYGVGDIENPYKNTYALNHVCIFDRKGHAISTFPYQESFETPESFISSGWTGNGYAPFKFPKGAVFRRDGDIVLYFYNNTYMNSIPSIITPQLDLSALKRPCISFYTPQFGPNIDFIGECIIYTSADGEKYTEFKTFDINTVVHPQIIMPEKISIPKETKFIKILPHATREIIIDSTIITNHDATEYHFDMFQIMETKEEETSYGDSITTNNSGALAWQPKGDDNSFNLQGWQNADEGEASLNYKDESAETLPDDSYYNLSLTISGQDSSKIDLYVETDEMLRSNNRFYLDKDGQYDIKLKQTATFRIVAQLKKNVLISEVPNVEISNMQIVPKSTTGIENNRSDKNIIIYLNPVKDNLIIKNIEVKSKIQIFNLQGQNIHTEVSTGNDLVIPVNNFTSGIYFVKIASVDGTFSKKIIIQ